VLILASESPRKAEILKCIPSNFEESPVIAKKIKRIY